MADVSRAPGRRGADAAARGQLLLATALVISVLFVVLAVILNAAVFTQNLGGRGTSDAVEDAARDYRVAAVETTGATIETVNRNNSTYRTFQRNLSRAVARWSELSARHAAVTGGSANVSLRATTNGSRIRQMTAGRNLTDAAIADNWTLVDGTTGVREAWIRVRRPSLVEPSRTATAANLTNASAFRVEVTADGDAWHAFVYRNRTGRVAVTVQRPDGALLSPCRTFPDGDGTVRVDLANASVEGEHCGPLAFFDEIDGARTIGFELGSNAAGVYSFVVDSARSSVDGGSYYDAAPADANHDESDRGPYVQEWVYAAEVRITYVTPAIRYRSQVRVVPGDADG